MRGLIRPKQPRGFLSCHALKELGTLQASVRALRGRRALALRMFVASRHATTAAAQREFGQEFSWLDRKYRAAVRRLAQFCLEHRSPRD